VLITFFSIKGIVHLNSFHRAKQSTKLIMCKCWSGYVKLCIEKGLNFDSLSGFSTVTVLQLTRCSLLTSFWPKNQLLKWNIHPIPVTELQMTSGCFQALKGWRFQDIQDIEKMWRQHWELFSDRNSKNVASDGSIIGLIA
jgi:hypothetical protein